MKVPIWKIAIMLSAGILLRWHALGDEQTDHGHESAQLGALIVPKPMKVFVRNLSEVATQRPRQIVRRGQSLYSWSWLVARFDKNGDGIVSSKELTRGEQFFENLDRDWDGQLTKTDFDWSEDTVLDRQKDTTFALFRTTDQNSDGKITTQEWQDLFAAAANGKEHLNDLELEQLVFRKLNEMRKKREQTLSERAQDRWGRFEHLLRSGKLFSDGPEPGEMAPDFVLDSHDETFTVRLSSFREQKPVVLIFGSFT